MKADVPIGARFGRLVVLSELERPVGTGPTRYQCQCDCGRITTTRATALIRQTSRSCGCVSREMASDMGRSMRRHGLSRKLAYRSWVLMLRRCFNKDAREYPRYGGRGITVCQRWRSVENFFADMGERRPGTTIDRIDNSGNYEPGNCRWSTPKQQLANRRTTIRLTFHGVTKTLIEWSEQTGIDRHVLKGRYRMGWTDDRTLTEPILRKPRHKL